MMEPTAPAVNVSCGCSAKGGNIRSGAGAGRRFLEIELDSRLLVGLLLRREGDRTHGTFRVRAD